jgi:hypothetical protein
MPLWSVRPMISVQVPRTGNPETDRALSTVAEALSALAALPANAGAPAIVSQALTTSDTRVYHGLGRAPLGWLVCGQTADATVYEVSTSDAPSEYINLRASASVTARLLFI